MKSLNTEHGRGKSWNWIGKAEGERKKNEMSAIGSSLGQSTKESLASFIQSALAISLCESLELLQMNRILTSRMFENFSTKASLHWSVGTSFPS